MYRHNIKHKMEKTTTFITNSYSKNDGIAECDVMSVTVTTGSNLVEITKYLDSGKELQIVIDRTKKIMGSIWNKYGFSRKP